MVACFGHFASHFNMVVFPAVVLPLVHKLNMEMSAVLGLSFWMYLMFGMTALPWGLLADRMGASRLMALYFLGSGVSGLGAVFWMDTPPAFAIALAGIGLFSGIYHPVGLGLISKGVTDVSTAMGFNGMFGTLGLALGPIVAGVLTWLWSPGAVYLALAAVNLIGLALVLRMPIATRTVSPEEEHSGGGSLVGAFAILLVAMMLGGLAYRGATVIMPAYLELKGQAIFEFFRDLSGGDLSGNLVATAVASFIYFVGIPGQYFGGKVASRFDPRWAYLFFNLIGMPAVFLMGYTHDLPLVFLAAVYFFFLLGMQPVENTLVARIAPDRFHHSAFGLKFILTFGVGALAVKMVGHIDELWGIEAVFPFLGLIALTLICSVALLIRLSQSSLAPRSASDL